MEIFIEQDLEEPTTTENSVAKVCKVTFCS